MPQFNTHTTMTLEEKITSALKEAMKAKDMLKLESLRAIKSQILLAKTQTGANSLTQSDEIKLLQRLVKQRQESAELYNSQGRTDLSEPEIAQADIIASFLPKQLTEQEVEQELVRIATLVGATSVKDLGRLMSEANKALEGKTQGKTIASIAKKILS